MHALIVTRITLGNLTRQKTTFCRGSDVYFQHLPKTFSSFHKPFPLKSQKGSWREENHEQWQKRQWSTNMNTSYQLTKDDVMLYLKKTLDIPHLETLLQDDKVKFLEKLMQQTKYKIPFTNIPFFTSEDSFTPLTLHQCKDAMMSAQGGNCVVINTFTQAVLEHLHFKIYQIGGSAYRWRKLLQEDDHVTMIVQDLSYPGSRHLVDPGNRYYLNTPISLDFHWMSPEYKIRYNSYKFFHVSHGVLHLCSKVSEQEKKSGNGSLIYHEDDRGWEVLSTFRTMDRKYLSDALNINERHADFITKVSNDLLLIGYPKGLLVNINFKRCLTMNANGQKESIRIENKDHLKEMVLKYFPQYSAEQVENAITFIGAKQKKAD